jgi:hypothetical protein
MMKQALEACVKEATIEALSELPRVASRAESGS